MVSPSNVRVCVAFWLLGLINNVLYVIILSAALDLVGPTIPKGVVLLADVLPSFLVKLTGPYYMHMVPYSARVVGFALLSALGMLIVALSPTSRDSHHVLLKLLGISLASVSSGGGELSFLGLTHFYGHASLASWSSGTGGAGIVGASAYVVATTTFALDPSASLLVFSFLPVIMLIAFFAILPPSSLGPTAVRNQYESLPSDEAQHEVLEDDGQPDQDLHSTDFGAHTKSDAIALSSHSTLNEFKANLQRAKALFLPYMLPLLTVYIAEYTINQGVAPTLLFPIATTPFREFRDFYPTYNAIYQFGVFISRSSTPFIRIHHLYAPSLLQVLNLLVLTLHALFDFLPSVWFVFIIVFWEGLLGGLVYVNTFAEISDNVPIADREFSLSATTVSDSGGICIAAFISMIFETALCDWQVQHGRDWCRSP